MLVLPEINFLHLILPVTLLLLGWMTPTPSQGPPIRGGRGDDGLWPWPWQGGWGGTRNLEHIFIYLFKVNLLSDSHGFTPPETEVTPKNASHLLRHPRNVWRSDPPWAPPHARPLRSQEGLGGLPASAVDPEAQGPVRDLSTKTSSLPVDG